MTGKGRLQLRFQKVESFQDFLERQTLCLFCSASKLRPGSVLLPLHPAAGEYPTKASNDESPEPEEESRKRHDAKKEEKRQPPSARAKRLPDITRSRAREPKDSF